MEFLILSISSNFIIIFNKINIEITIKFKTSKFHFLYVFWTLDLPDGPLVITYMVRPCMCVCLSLNILKTAHQFFLKLCMELGINKVKKVTRSKFWKNILIRGLMGIKCKDLGFRHFHASGSFKVSNFLHDSRRK